MDKKYISINMATSDNDKIFEFFNSIKENVGQYHFIESNFLTFKKSKIFNIDVETKKWDAISIRYSKFKKEEILFIDFYEVVDIPSFIKFLENLLNQEVLNLL